MLLAVFVGPASAAPKLTSVFPAGVARGPSTVITITGEFPNWPVQVWDDRQGVTIEAQQDKGKLKVSVDRDLQPGVCWFRVYDKTGGSALRPLLFGTLGETLEKEPNDDPTKPQKLAGSTTINGRLEKRGDVDGYAISLRRGQTLIASMLAHRTLASPMDGVLQVCDARGFVLAQNDEGHGLDPQIVFKVPRDGDYLVRTFAFPVKPNSTIGFAGGADFVYRLTVTTGGFVDHTLPLAVERSTATPFKLFGWNLSPKLAKHTISAFGYDSVVFSHPQLANTLRLPVYDSAPLVAREDSSPQKPQAVKLPAMISGRIESAGDVDVFRFPAVKGRKVSVRVESRRLGYPLDPALRVFDAAGKVVAEIDDSKDADDKDARDARLQFSPAADGEYRVEVRDLHGHGGFRYVYRLTVEEPKPGFTLKLAAGQFVLTKDKPLEIPIAIERRNGFSGEITITALDLPDGVTVTATKSAAKGDTALAVKLKLTSDGRHASNPIQIRGASGNLAHLARFALTSPADTHTAVWLTVQKSAEK
jgi:hypothetical protein